MENNFQVRFSSNIADRILASVIWQPKGQHVVSAQDKIMAQEDPRDSDDAVKLIGYLKAEVAAL